MPPSQTKATLNKRKQSQNKRGLISPIFFLAGVLGLAVLILGFNLKHFSLAIQNSAGAVEYIDNNNNNDGGVAVKVEGAASTTADNQVMAQRTALEEEHQEKQNDAAANEPNGGNDNNDIPQYHIIFSTGCSAFQDWQSYIFFFHAAKILKTASPPLSAMQNTEVTRIASGCGSEQDVEAMHKLHKEQIEIMSPLDNFHLHITPDFSYEHGEKKAYKYFNKPYGTKHWMEHVLGYKDEDHEDRDFHNPKHDNDIVILCDPDQIMLRPFANDFSQKPEQFRSRKDFPIWEKITHGQPFGQQYGFHAQWYLKTDITKIAKPSELPSPLESMSNSMKNENFAAGPPYVMTAHDMYLIISKWSEFAVPTYKQYPFLLAEMFAMCLAAAHLNMPLQIVQSYMVSDVGPGPIEGWKYGIDNYPIEDMCQEGAIPQDRLPNVLHYCQRYWLGKWFIGKYKLPHDFLSCKSPLLKVPPKDIGSKYDYAIAPGNGERKELKQDHIKRYAFMLCTFIPALNDAARFYKEHHCQDPNEPANMEETLVFHKNMDD